MCEGGKGKNNQVVFDRPGSIGKSERVSSSPRLVITVPYINNPSLYVPRRCGMRIFCAAWLAVCLLCTLAHAVSQTRQRELRDEVAALFRHGYDGYMTHAYPADELRPLTCGPLHRDPDVTNHGINDIHANVSMTLLDVLSTLPLIHPGALPDALAKASTVSFDQDVKVQVFELTIRAMGAFLSTYQYLDRLPADPTAQAKSLGLKGRVDVKKYQARMLELAYDLGKRLLPAFETPTGIPYSRVNLRSGVEKGESQDTCAAGAGSLILEFAVLSRLTGDRRFETLAQKAYLAIWNRRSPHELLGNTIGALHGHWLVPGLSGVGAGMDSFFEYGIKAAILLNDDTYLDIFHDSYAAIQTHVRANDGFIYRPTQFRSLQLASPSTIDSLAAFLPGMQVLAGDLESAIKHHLVYWNLWRRYSAIPESWAWDERKVVWTGWPGRPEFIEANYYLYRATKDPFYLRVGERILIDIKRRVKTQCGFATMRDVESGDLEDRMESFMLSETLKYLYLLFDDTQLTRLSNQVFTTEGHPLSMPVSMQKPPSSARRILHRGENVQCPVYRPPTLGGLVVGIEQRRDYEYARSLVYGPGVDGRVEEHGHVHWSEKGFCEVPRVPRFSVDIVLSPLDSQSQTPPADHAPSPSKVRHDTMTGDFVISDVDGLHLTLRWRFDNQGYEVATIGPHRVRPGQQVIVTDPKMEGYLPVASPDLVVETHLPSEVMLRFSSSSLIGPMVFLHALGATATFGRDFGVTGKDGFGLGARPVRVILPPLGQRFGCEPLARPEVTGEPFVFLLERGECVFLDKLTHATVANASGVILFDQADEATGQAVLSDGHLIRPSADGSPEEQTAAVEGTGMVFTAKMVGDIVKKTIEAEKKDVVVELLRVEGGMQETRGQSEKRRGEEGAKGREGRLALGAWEIWNLKIVEAL